MTKQYSERYKKYLKTIVTNNGYNIENLSYDDMREIYHKIKSDMTRKAHDKWLTSCLLHKDTFGSRVKQVYIKKAQKFIQENCIENNFTDDELSSLGWSIMFDRKKHGEKIKKGINKKYPNVREEYARRFYQRVATTNNKSIKDVTTIDITNFLKQQKFFNHNVLEWKRKHVIKFLGIIPINDQEIEELYSLYLSKRFIRASIECKTNGWSRTLKDWYYFTNIKLDFFYRSSWEKVVCELFDEMLLTGEILNVFIPDTIEYVFENSLRRYFPDIGIIDKNGQKKIFEIKPQEHVDLPINQAKFESAHKIYNDKFKILTEREIFNVEVFRSCIYE